MKIGWIGLGHMGLPMSRRVRDAGHAITAYVRSDAGRQRAEASGYQAVTELRRVADGADIVISSILDDAALLDIVSSPAGLAAHLHQGQIYVDTSTVSPVASTEVARLLEDRQVDYLRAPVSGSTATAEAGALTTLVSGPRSAFDRVLPVISAFARKQFFVGADEQARFLKLALNVMVAATSSLLAESLAISRKGGVELATALEVFANSAVASPLLDYKREMILEGKFEAAFPVSGMMKDLDLALSVGRLSHLPLPLVALVRQQFEAAYARGNGDKDFFVLVGEVAEAVGLAP